VKGTGGSRERGKEELTTIKKGRKNQKKKELKTENRLQIRDPPNTKRKTEDNCPAWQSGYIK